MNRSNATITAFTVHSFLRTATNTEWPPRWFLKLTAADRRLRCMVLFWLFFVLVLVLSEAVLVLSEAVLVLSIAVLVLVLDAT
ncbi:MAG: hypothetical protein ACK6AO_13725 [Planctomycetota bacterium]